MKTTIALAIVAKLEDLLLERVRDIETFTAVIIVSIVDKAAADLKS